MNQIIFIFLFATADSFIQAAPWLIFGFVVAGLIHVLVPTSLIKRLLSGNGISSILKGSLIGIPLPLCSCSVIPVARSLRQSGASIGATASFLTSTPQIGIDSFILTKGLLGLPMAILRVAVAFYSSILAGILVRKYGEETRSAKEIKECCRDAINKSDISGPVAPSFLAFLKYAFITIPSDLFAPLSMGFLVAGLVASFLPVQVAEASSGVLGQVLLMLIISIPTYTCAVSSTPIAQALFLKGIHPAAILVFLIAGPASNATTILATREEFGNKGMFAYLSALTVATLTSSYAVYYYYEIFFKKFTLASVYNHHDHGQYNIFYLYSAFILCLILIVAKLSIYRSQKLSAKCH